MLPQSASTTMSLINKITLQLFEECRGIFYKNYIWYLLKKKPVLVLIIIIFIQHWHIDFVVKIDFCHTLFLGSASLCVVASSFCSSLNLFFLFMFLSRSWLFLLESFRYSNFGPVSFRIGRRGYVSSSGRVICCISGSQNGKKCKKYPISSKNRTLFFLVKSQCRSCVIQQIFCFCIYFLSQSWFL